jgi:uncharacterized protein
MARGVGVGFREEMAAQTEVILEQVDFLEYNFNKLDYEEELSPFLGRMPIVVHSVNLSLGSVEPPPAHRVELLKQAVQRIRPSWVSEHLSYSRAEGIEINNFIAIPYTEEAIENVAGHIRNLSQTIGCQIAMENITHPFTWPGSQYSEAEFIREVLERADCGLLLDVTNLYLNALTFGYDPYAFLEALPKERILQLHLAGHSTRNGELLDTHVGGIHPEVMKYTEWVLKNTPCDALIIERDNEFSCFEDLLPDLQLCRELYKKYRNAKRISS